MLITMLAAWLFMAIAPETAIGRGLWGALVERPAAWLNRWSRGQVAALATSTVLGGIVLMIGGGDGVRMLMMAAPELATWLTTFEIATYLDVLIATVATWSTLQVGSPLRRLRLRLSGRRAGQASRTRQRKCRTADNDDEPHRSLQAA